MSIFVIGINHKTAPVGLRERVYFAPDKLALYLQDLTSRGDAAEAVLLSTCNRSELYCETHDIERVIHWFCAQTALSREELLPVLYVHQDHQALVHMMQVASGLDSMILGEPQILGQMKMAFSEGCAAGTVGALFHQVFQQLFSLAKEVRSTTAIGACPVSVASAATHFAKQQAGDLSNAHVLIIGAGDTTALLLRYLQSQLLKPVVVVNRHIEKAHQLVEGMSAQVKGLDKLAEALTTADVVFSATGSPTPLVSMTMMQSVMQLRQGRPLFLLDVAVPRDIEAEVATLSNVHLFCIDDLKMIIEKNRQGREHAAEKALEMIEEKARGVMLNLASLDETATTIRAYRGKIETICHLELMKAKQQIQQGSDPLQVLDSFAYTFTQKLLHAPSVQLRQAGAEGRFELLELAKQLFAIPELDAKIKI